MRIEATDDGSVFAAEVVCSSGTYVRTLAADLGTALGGGAHLRNLRRTKIGSFTVAEAHTLETLTTEHMLSPAQAMRDLDRVVIDGEMSNLVSRGLPLDRVHAGAVGDGPWAVLDARGELLAVYEATETDRIKPAVVLSAT